MFISIILLINSTDVKCLSVDGSIWGTDVMTSIRCLFIFYYFILVIFWNLLYAQIYSAEVVPCLFLVLGWNSVPNMWQVVLSNVSIHSRVVHSYIYCHFDGPSHIVSLPAYDSKVFHWCYVPSVVLVFKNMWWCLQMFLIYFSKNSGLLLYIQVGPT